MTQKILAAHAGKENVKAGELIGATIDLALANDITAPIGIKEFEKYGFQKIFNKEKVALVMDHFTPNKDIKAAEQCKFVREFARKHEITHFYDVGQMGIEHVLLPEKGLVAPGEVVIGADSHTCTYGALGAFSTGVGSTDLAAGLATGKAWFKVPEAMEFRLSGSFQKWVSGKDLILFIIGEIGVEGALYRSMEFTGDGVSSLSMDDRFTVANMAIEAGAKNGIFPVDETTFNYLKGRVKKNYTVYSADQDAPYQSVMKINLSELRPMVACPHLPENTKPADEVRGVRIDQAVIGSCTNGRMDDLRAAAAILKGRKVDPSVRTIILPGTQEISLQAVREGLVEIFLEAGAVFSTPTCGPCLGGHMGILAKGERAISTTNRNFVGRMGHTESEVYLASPAVAAASAIAGEIIAPDKL